MYYMLKKVPFMKRIKSFPFTDWVLKLEESEKNECISSLENGQVLYFPKLDFLVEEKEKANFSSELVSKDRKNISYDPLKNEMKGCIGGFETQDVIHLMMKRYSSVVNEYVLSLLPEYKDHLTLARTSFRPVEIEGREVTSYRKNDTLLHVDSFPSNPTGGMRILRFFTNVNPFDKPRVWRVGEPYEDVAKRFLKEVKKPFPLSRVVMEKLGITKSYRILYDHYMLGIHNTMKADQNYQKEVDQERVEFPTGSSWACFTDQVSHAVVSGQYVFEQSFYLSLEGLKHKESSPLGIMEKLLKQKVTV